jgi:hypothetical protein
MEHAMQSSGDKAKDLYNKAKQVKSDEKYPQEQIDWINQQIQLASKEEAEAAYKKLLSDADSKFAAREYQAAKDVYTSAVKMRPDDNYPKSKIKEIDKILADLAANKENQKKEEEYKAALAKADAARDAKQWDNAKDLYKKANTIKPEDKYPQDQINWINNQMKQETEAQLQEAYQKLINVADTKFSAKDYQEARNLYTRATSMRPDDSYPKNKIAEIDKILAQESVSKEQQKKLEEYKNAIAQADAARDDKQWNKAKDLYKKAHGIKSDEKYPQQQIDWINEQMKLEAEKEGDAAYQKLIDVADTKFSEESYNDAKKLYERAVNLKPADPYPKKRLEEIEERLKQLAEEKARSADKEKSNALYQQYITKGRENQDGKKYKEAIAQYRLALGVKPDAPFPREKIAEIEAILNQMAEEKAQKEAADRERGITTNQQSSYGEEVFMSEEDLVAMFNKSKIDQTTYWADQVEDYVQKNQTRIDSSSTALKDKIDARNVEYRQFETERIQKEIESDRTRQDIVVQVENYSDTKLSEEEQLKQSARDRTFETETVFRNVEQERNDMNVDFNVKRDNLNIELERYKDTDKAKQEIVDNTSRETTYTQYLKTQEKQQEWIERDLGADKTRQNNTVSVDTYKDNRTNEVVELQETNLDRNYSTHEHAERLRETRTHLFDEADNTREKNAGDLTSYIDSKIERDNEINKTREGANFGVQQRLDNFSDARTLKEQEQDEKRQELTIDLEKYKDEKIGQEISMTERAEKTTYGAHQYAEQLEIRIAEQFVEADNTRNRVSSEMTDYKDERYTQKENWGEQSEKMTYSAHEYADNLEIKMAQMFDDADKTRQENQVNLEQYKDNKTDLTNSRKEEFTNRGFETKESFNTIETERAEQFKEADNTRNKNAESFTSYGDGLNDAQATNATEQGNKSFGTYNAGEDLRTQIGKQNEQADNSRQLYASKTESYKDAALDKQNDAQVGKSDKLYDRAIQMEQAKNQNPEELTADYQNELARVYGQGVTESKYARKNDRGEVVEVTIQRIVVEGNKGHLYKKVIAKHGTTYFKDNGIISEHIWDIETSSPITKK